MSKKVISNIKNLKTNNFIKELDYYGYTKINKFLNSNQTKYLLNLVNKEYEKINKAKKFQYNGVPERNKYDKILYNLFNLDNDFINLLDQPIVREIAKQKLNDPYYGYLPDDSPNYCLSYYNARSSGNKLDLHIDSHIPYLSEYTFSLQFTFLLEDSYVENGCTTAVPGSHKSGKFTDRTISKIENLTGKSGDLLIWDSRLWHGTNENVIKTSRWALIATLTSWWVKPAVDIVRSIDKTIYSKCNKRQKQLLGFCAIPPKNIFERNNTKNGYKFLQKNIKDYNI